MSANTFYLKQGDTDPAIEETLSGNAMPPFPNDAVLAFTMKRVNADTPKVNAATATLVDVETGKARYEWAAGDTDTPGTYRAEWKLTWNDGKDHTLRFPNDGYTMIVITPKLS